MFANMPFGFQLKSFFTSDNAVRDAMIRIPVAICASGLFLPVFYILPQAPKTPALPKTLVLSECRMNGFLIFDQEHLRGFKN